MGVAGLGIGQDFANEVYGMWHFEGVSLFFSFYHQGGTNHLHGGRDVEQKRFFVGRRDQDRGLCQELLDLVKRLLGLERPFETVGLLQEPIDGETSFAEARDKAAECGEAPYNSLNPLYILNRAHSCDGLDFLQVGFDDMLGDDEAEQHAPRDPENSLLGVEFDAICSEFC